ncbi:MAG: CoA-binding protein, partial [Candidatus Micrarchaeota archaeon]
MDDSTRAGLKALTNPKSVAVIGASADPNKVGYGVLKSLVEGCVFKSYNCSAFAGSVHPVNPRQTQILGRKCFPRIQDIPEDIDLAVIAVPSSLVLQIMGDCAEKKVKAAIIISAGFAETGKEGRKLQDEVLAVARAASIRILGPNVLGILRPPISLNASFALSMPESGEIAFISQSGALADSVVDWALEARYSFSLIVSLGNAADLDVSDFLEFCLEDPGTKAITLYLEGIKDGKKFLKVAREVTKFKPVILLKGGRSARGEKAIASHTGSLAGSFAVYEAAMRQAGVFMAESVEDLFDLAKALSEQPRVRGRNVAIVTNGGGVGVLTADYCDAHGLNVVDFMPETISKLDSSGKMHAAYSRANPLDLVGDALPERYDAALNILLQEKYIDGIIVVQTLQTMTRSKEDAEIVVAAHRRFPNKPIVCVFMGGKYSAEGVSVLRQNNIPDYNDPLKAVKVMKAL